MKERDCPKGTALSELGEFGLIERVLSFAPKSDSAGLVGPGDDCAVIPQKCLFAQGGEGCLLVTTDGLVEGRHFRLDYSTPFDVGWKSLAVSISDIAAMGGTALAAFVTLQLRSDLAVELIEDLYRGVYAVAERYGVSVMGGDTVAAREFAISWSVVGSCEKPPLLRSGAKPGDHLWISGSLGGAAAALAILESGHSRLQSLDGENELLERHRRPAPRLALGRTLLEKDLANAMIDISDGLLQDAGHLARQSEVQLVLDLNAIPYQSGVLESGYGKVKGLIGGDDYELLFAVPSAKCQMVEELSESLLDGDELPRLTRIGDVREGLSVFEHEVVLLTEGGSPVSAQQFLREAGLGELAGYQHF